MLQTLKNWFQLSRKTVPHHSNTHTHTHTSTPKIFAEQVHLHWHVSDATPIPGQVTWNSKPIVSFEPAVEPIEIKPAVRAAFDEALLERARTQWQFGDWDSLAALTREVIEGHPERAKLALLAAAGHQQIGDMDTAKTWVNLSKTWGCDKQLISRVLIAGTYNTLGKAAALSGREDKALAFFAESVRVGMPGGEGRLLINARANEQFAQMRIGEQNKQLEDCLSKRASQSVPPLLSKNTVEIQHLTLRKSESSTTIKIDRNVVDREKKNISPEDLVNASFDSCEQSRTTNILIIFSTPRCGSTLLCDILKKNNICVAHEYFQPYQYMPLLAERWGCIDKDFLDPAVYVSALCRYRTLPNGWLGINLHSSHISIFDRMLQQFPEANFRYIHLMRRDTLSQAISYAIAKQTDQWSSRFESVAEAKYDFKMIKNLYNSIIDGNALIDAYISTHNLPCNKCYFEDLTENPGNFFLSLSKVIPQADSIKFVTTLNRQSADMNIEWENKYKEDLYISMQGKKSGSIEFI